jgi:hypothetical protein
MRKTRVKMIYKLIYNKDPNTLNTIKRYRGETLFSEMNGNQIFRWAKRLWTRYGIVDNWGQTN